MFSTLNADLEPAASERWWYGSVFGMYCLLGAADVVIGLVKHGDFRFVVMACSLVVFGLALHSFIVGMRPHPPARQLSARMRILSLVVILPWVARLFLQ